MEKNSFKKMALYKIMGKMFCHSFLDAATFASAPLRHP